MRLILFVVILLISNPAFGSEIFTCEEATGEILSYQPKANTWLYKDRSDVVIHNDNKSPEYLKWKDFRKDYLKCEGGKIVKKSRSERRAVDLKITNRKLESDKEIMIRKRMERITRKLAIKELKAEGLL